MVEGLGAEAPYNVHVVDLATLQHVEVCRPLNQPLAALRRVALN